MISKGIASYQRTRTENPETDTIHDPLIFSVIDEGLPYRWIPSCVNEPKIRFLKRFPKIGSCLICPLKSLDGETSSTKAVLICDTLSPPGTGSPIKKVLKRTNMRLFCFKGRSRLHFAIGTGNVGVAIFAASHSRNEERRSCSMVTKSSNTNRSNSLFRGGICHGRESRS